MLRGKVWWARTEQVLVSSLACSTIWCTARFTCAVGKGSERFSSFFINVPNCLFVVFWSVSCVRLLRALYRVKDDFCRRILKIIVLLIDQIEKNDETYQSSIIWFEANIKKLRLYYLWLYMISSNNIVLCEYDISKNT